MNKRAVVGISLCATLVVAAFAGAGAGAATTGAAVGMSGHFSLVNMVHTTQYQGQDLGTNEPQPWNGAREEGGPFVYAGIACTGNAPVNNISTDLTTYNTRLEGSRSPASTRSHPFQFNVVRNRDGKLRLRGLTTLTVCQLKSGPTPTPDPIPDAEKSKIYIRWNAQFKNRSAEEVSWWGTFKIIGGTGLYEDLTGSGDIAGYFFCFAPEGCTTLGEFRDGQYTMAGTYSDPTAP